MTQLKLCYRADFSQPIGALNPGGFKLPGTVTVEVRKCNGKWRAFRPNSNAEFCEITSQSTAEAIKSQMPVFFKEQVTPWKAFDSDGRPLNSEDIYTDPKGRTYRTEITK